MSLLFEPAKIGNMPLRNRFVRSATYDACADKTGHVSEKQTKLYAELASGGVGLIVTGLAYVNDSGQHLPFQNSIAGDEFISSLKKLTDVVHDQGSKIAIQIYHAGRERAGFVEHKKELCAAPSHVRDDPFFDKEYSAMTDDEIWFIVQAFGSAARRARAAGFDAVQVHGAHAFLLSQFLSPFTNLRDDGWGGSLENRLRFHHEVYQAMRKEVGQDYPLLIKFGVQDGFQGGLEFKEGKVAAQMIAGWGFDALEISQGLRGKPYGGTEFRTGINTVEREAYYRDWGKEIRSTVSVPVMLVGGLRTCKLMEQIIRNGEADFVSMSRPFIREPALVNEWKSGSDHRAKCISCNKCLEAIKKGETLHCVQQRAESTKT